MACSYDNGFFIHPHDPRHQMCLKEDVYSHDLHAPMRVSFDAVMGPGELSDVVAAGKQAGGTSVCFNNYSKASMQALRRTRPALDRVNLN